MRRLLVLAGLPLASLAWAQDEEATEEETTAEEMPMEESASEAEEEVVEEAQEVVEDKPAAEAIPAPSTGALAREERKENKLMKRSEAMFFTLSVGPLIKLSDDLSGGVRFFQEWGTHFRGKPDAFYLGVFIAESIGSGFIFTTGARVGYDITAYNGEKFGLITGPWVGTGFNFGNNASTDDNANFGWGILLGLDVKFKLPKSRITPFIRPVGLDINISSPSGTRYEMQAGVFVDF